jgi:predicted ATPase/class 3 adenylate cyclase
MRTASKMLEYLVAAEVAVQAMVMVWRIAGLGNVSMAGKTRLLQAACACAEGTAFRLGAWYGRPNRERAPTSVPVAEPGVMMGLEINTLAMRGCRGGGPRCRFVEMRLLKVVGLPVSRMTALPAFPGSAASRRDMGEMAGAAASRREESAADRAAVILTPDQRVRVFISSTLEELAEERAAALRAIRRLHLVPVWFESGARPHPPQSMYRAYLDQSQIFVGIYWQRYGWVGPGMEISGLEDEYRLAAGKPMLLYLKHPAPHREPGLTAMIEDIRAAGTVSYRAFATARELERLLTDDLAVVLSERFAGAAIGAVAELPAGTVTFLLTDIEGSTRLWESDPEAMEVALQRHDRLLAKVIGEHGGAVVISRGEGDSFFAVFPSAVSAVEAAGMCQLRLGREAWPTDTPLRVRMGLHTGEARVRGGDHVDYTPINRCARVRAAAHGGQVLLTKTTCDLVAGRLGGGFGLKRLGEFRLRDLVGRELIYQLTHADLPDRFPPIRTLAERAPRPLPAGTTSLVGREQSVDELAGLLAQPGVRLVTLTGPGGVGKTRLALAVGERAGGRFGSGAVFVPLAGVTAPELVVGGIGRAVGADLAGTGAPLQALAEQLGDGAWLLILDNLEQAIDAARDLDELLARCPGVVIVATSRTVLGLRAEREYPVPPLPLPAGHTAMALQELRASPAVALFVDRARAVRPNFALTEGNAAAVAAICRHVDGLPLAIELAAARTRLLDPDALLDRLSKSLDALGTGTVDLPERQRTLRATVEWSMGLLDDAERSLLETMAVFAGGWTVGAAAEVAGLAEGRALDLTEALARHSLVQPDNTERGPRLRMLETIRAFVAERLADRPDAAEVARRHADYYRALAAQADRSLRRAGHREWAERLQEEAGNLAAAVRWYLAHDPEPLPHLFRVLWLFWDLRDDLGEVRAWVEQLLPTADTLDPQARAELLWTAAVTAVEMGDDPAALAARQHLEPLLDQIGDPFLRALCELALAWTSTIGEDLDGALREASASLAEFRGQDAPVWAASAGLTVGGVETTVGRYDDALGHLTEVRELAERSDNSWSAAMSRVGLGTLALVRGRADEARALLDDALDLSLAARSTRSVTLCLAALARWALVAGDPERAALVAGAAEGLRRRAGLRAWPILRQGEADLVAHLQQALGADHFDQVFATGTRLTQRDAATAARASTAPAPG